MGTTSIDRDESCTCFLVMEDVRPSMGSDGRYSTINVKGSLVSQVALDAGFAFQYSHLFFAGRVNEIVAELFNLFPR